MSAMQAAFVREYLKDGNGAQAAIRAGYKPKAAKEQASVLLTRPNIRLAVDTGLSAMHARVIEKTAVTKAMVVQMALDAHNAAKEAGVHSAVSRNVELLAKLHGHIVERRDVRVIKSVEDLADDELAALEAQASRLEARH